MPKAPKARQARHSLLQHYRLERAECRTLPAQSESHSAGEVRMRPRDLERLRKHSPGEDYEPVVVLFSTGNAQDPVFLRTAETIYIDISKGARPRRKRQRRNGVSGTNTDIGSSVIQDAHANQVSNTDDRSNWQAMTVVASHAFVVGMHVSGVIHRAVVRLVRYA